jgi:hypothetical protein
MDFSCDVPMVMLDVNARVEGDVQPWLTAYDHEENLRTLRTLCARYGVEVSAQAAADLVHLFESFECAPQAGS